MVSVGASWDSTVDHLIASHTPLYFHCVAAGSSCEPESVTPASMLDSFGLLAWGSQSNWAKPWLQVQRDSYCVHTVSLRIRTFIPTEPKFAWLASTPFRAQNSTWECWSVHWKNEWMNVDQALFYFFVISILMPSFPLAFRTVGHLAPLRLWCTRGSVPPFGPPYSAPTHLGLLTLLLLFSGSLLGSWWNNTCLIAYGAHYALYQGLSGRIALTQRFIPDGSYFRALCSSEAELDVGCEGIWMSSKSS